MPRRCLRLKLVVMLVLCAWYLVLCSGSTVEFDHFKCSRTQAKNKVQSALFGNKKAASKAASCRSFCCRSLYDYYSFVFVKIGEHHLYDFALFCRHKFADVIRLNRQLAMLVASINQNR